MTSALRALREMRFLTVPRASTETVQSLQLGIAGLQKGCRAMLECFVGVWHISPLEFVSVI